MMNYIIVKYPQDAKVVLGSESEYKSIVEDIIDDEYFKKYIQTHGHHNVLDTETACIKYAIAVAHDIDGYDGMAFSRWLSDVMNNYDINIEWENYV